MKQKKGVLMCMLSPNKQKLSAKGPGVSSFWIISDVVNSKQSEQDPEFLIWKYIKFNIIAFFLKDCWMILIPSIVVWLIEEKAWFTEYFFNAFNYMVCPCTSLSFHFKDNEYQLEQQQQMLKPSFWKSRAYVNKAVSKVVVAKKISHCLLLFLLLTKLALVPCA